MSNQEKIKVALSKLTEEERELLGLNKPVEVKEEFELTIEYTIGDADGVAVERKSISLNNPFLKPLTDALDKLVELKGYCNVSLETEVYDYNKELGNINDFECELLTLITEYEYDSDYISDFLKRNGYEDSDENYDYLCEFEGMLYSDSEYSYLTYRGCEIE